MRLPVVGIAAIALGSLARAQTELFTRIGDAAGDQFGSAVAFVGDVDADGAVDFAVGAPFADVPAADAGMARVYSGRTYQALYTWRGASANAHFGTALAGAGDLDGDGRSEVVVGAPGGSGSATVLSGASGLALHTFIGSGSYGFGSAVAGGGLVDGDAVADLLVGEPYQDAGGNWSGRVYVISGATGATIRTHDGTQDYATFGWSVAFLGDVTGDGRDDYAVGAPAASSNFTTSYVRAFDGASGVVLWTNNLTSSSDEFGWSLAPIADVSGDGVRDVIVGAMQDAGIGCGGCNGKGYVRALDGATGGQLYQINNNGVVYYVGFGWAVAVVGDLDGNGYEDFAVSRPGTEGCGGTGALALQVRDGQSGALIASLAVPSGGQQFGYALASGDANADGLRDLVCSAPCQDSAGSYTGALYAYTIVRAPTVYCVSETNSLGCTPSIAGSGTASASNGSPFVASASSVINHKSGLLFYGFKPRQTPFQGGHMCVVAPTIRTPIQSSGGNAPPVNDCSGVFSLDFNARIRSGVDPLLVAGEEVFAQFWSRDPPDASTTNLTDALAFYINP
jgi:hypothetical protein